MRPSDTPETARRERWRETCLSILLLLQLAVIFASAPLDSIGLAVTGVLAGLVLLAMTACVVVAAPSGEAAKLALAAFALYGIAVLARSWRPDTYTFWLAALGGLATIAIMTWVTARAVFGPGPVSRHRIRGAIVIYFNIALAFSVCYRLMEELSPARHFGGIKSDGGSRQTAEDLLYFSVITLSTTGYGDIAPLTRTARSLASLEAVLGQLYIATFLGRLITLATEHAKGERRGE